MVERVTDWVRDVAKGAALMTQTSVSENFLTGCYDILSNQALTDILTANFEHLGKIPYDEADRQMAAELQETYSTEEIQSTLDMLPEDQRRKAEGRSLYSTPNDIDDQESVNPSSGDNGNVSYIVPTAQFYAATWPVGTAPHTWQAVAASGDFGLKAVPYVSKVFAGTVWDLMTDSSLLKSVQAEFRAETEGLTYESPLPEGTELPFELTASESSDAD